MNSTARSQNKMQILGNYKTFDGELGFGVTSMGEKSDSPAHRWPLCWGLNGGGKRFFCKYLKN